MQLGEEEGGQREKPGPCDTVKPEWPAQMETSDVVEDKVEETRVDRAGGLKGFLWTRAAMLPAGSATELPINHP